MPYPYTGPVPPTPAPSLPASDPAWVNWWNYQTAVFRTADMAVREAANVIAKQSADAQTKLADNMLKPTLRDPVLRAKRVADLAEQLQSNDPGLSAASAVRVAEAFFTTLQFNDLPL